jgi:formylmethanofuran dehydrogenase subunit E
MKPIEELLIRSAALHRQLCPRQVLGVRMGLAGTAALGLEVPRKDKRLLVIVETDGCFVDGIEAATGCCIGHRTLRVVDYGKVGATFVHVGSGEAIRLSPQEDVRQRAWLYAPEQEVRYDAQLVGYQRMPDSELFVFKPVALITPQQDLVSRPGLRVNCDGCGEEIINEREVRLNGMVLCYPCSGESYYQVSGVTQPIEECVSLNSYLKRDIATGIVNHSD